MLTCLKPLNMRARRDCQNFTEPRSIAQNLRCNVHGSLPRARAEALDMSSCFAPGDEHLRIDQSALPAHAVNGTLRCAPHGKRESESGRNAERASSSQQHEREGATRVEPHANASGSHLRRWLLLGKVVPGSATRQSNHQRSILKEMTLPAFESTRRARASQYERRVQGRATAQQPLRCDTKRLGSAGGAGTAHLLEQRPHPAGGGAKHASARQSGVSRHAADRKRAAARLATMPSLALATIAAKSYSYEMNGSHLRKLAVPPERPTAVARRRTFFGTALEGRGTIRTIIQVRGSSLDLSQKNILRQMLII